MNTINFGEFNSYRDFSLILTSKSIGSAQPKLETVDIPGGDGVIDYTEYFGDVRFNNRTLIFDFQTPVPPSEFPSLFSQIQNELHGKRMKVVLSEEDDFYYIGRIIVNEWKSNRRIGKVTIEVEADPWKYRESETIRTIAVNGASGFTLTNLRRHVTPTLEVSGTVTLTFNNKIYTLTEGVYEDSSIILKQGNNYFLVSGAGTVTFKYQEGGL